MNKILIFAILIFTSCNISKHDTNNTVLNFKFEKVSILPKHMFINNIETILLKSDCVLVSKIKKLEFYNDLLFISEEKKIHCYDLKKEEFIYSITDYGKGPNQYLYLTNFFLNRAENKLGIVDIACKKILFYNISSGIFIQKVSWKSKQSPVDVNIINDTTYLNVVYNRDIGVDEYRYNVFTTNNQGNIQSKHLKIPIQWRMVRFEENETTTFNENYLIPIMNVNAIYEYNIHSAMLTKKYTIDFEDFKFEINKLLKNSKSKNYAKIEREFISKFKKSDYVLSPIRIYETEDHLAIVCLYQNTNFTAYYDKFTGRSISSAYLIIDDVLQSITNSKVKGVLNDQFVFVANSSNVVNELTNLKKQLGDLNYQHYIKNHDYLEEVSTNISNNDNPILFLISLNEFK